MRRARFADVMAGLATPPRRRPRFVLEAAALTLARPRDVGGLGVVRRVLGSLAARRARGRGGSLHLAVPAALARSRADMEVLVAAWRRRVGPCRLRLVRDADDAEALLASRGGWGAHRRVSVQRTRRWIQ